MTRKDFERRRQDAIRSDYIHVDRYASLGLSAVDRSPVAFLSAEDRSAVLEQFPMAHVLPPSLTLTETANLLRGETIADPVWP